MHTKINKEQISLIVLRIMISVIIATHGWHRLLTNGSPLFGEWLVSQGLPFGFYIAWFITLFEIAGSPILAFGKIIPHLSLVYILIYFSGMIMVHLPNGWFVVGSGTNGIEYSLLLIISLFCVSFPHFNELKNSIFSKN